MSAKDNPRTVYYAFKLLWKLMNVQNFDAHAIRLMFSFWVIFLFAVVGGDPNALAYVYGKHAETGDLRLQTNFIVYDTLSPIGNGQHNG